jgi:RNA polymerase sigma-70 factor (ECF subfamily)
MIDLLKLDLDAYFYLHGLRGALPMELHRFHEAREALNRAIALANSVAGPNSFGGSWIVSPA